MIIRELSFDDYHNHYYILINQLFKLPDINVTYDDFCKIIDNMKQQNGFTYVISDDETRKIIACGKIIIELKSHGSKMGIIQDVVVDSNMRGLGLGKKIVEQLIDRGKKEKCYKIILNSNDNNINFYEKCGFEKKGVEMCVYNVNKN